MKRIVQITSAILAIWLFACIYLQSYPAGQSDMASNDIYEVHEDSGVLTKIYINASGHVYPYTATAVTFTCLLLVLVIIIVCGPNLD